MYQVTLNIPPLIISLIIALMAIKSISALLDLYTKTLHIRYELAEKSELFKGPN